jgi:hypothetical protein
MLICLSLILIFQAILLFRDHYVRTKLQRLMQEKFLSMKGILSKLAAGDLVTEVEIAAIAKDPSLRIPLFHALSENGYQKHFYAEYFTEERNAEGYMVNWLEYPTELGRAPDEIILLKIVNMNLEIAIHYYVFRFRAKTPKWANKLNWMLGVCGPYDHRSLPLDLPRKIFSRFNSVEYTDPDAEADWVHNNINA